MDESNGTCNKRFAAAGIPQTEEARRAYRELIVTTPGLGESISGTILYDETIRQSKKDGTPFRPIRFARVLTSPLQRARPTCELAGLGRRRRLKRTSRNGTTATTKVGSPGTCERTGRVGMSFGTVVQMAKGPGKCPNGPIG